MNPDEQKIFQQRTITFLILACALTAWLSVAILWMYSPARMCRQAQIQAIIENFPQPHK